MVPNQKSQQKVFHDTPVLKILTQSHEWKESISSESTEDEMERKTKADFMLIRENFSRLGGPVGGVPSCDDVRRLLMENGGQSTASWEF
ncbi:hypothetical protein Aduo_018613 [Ancylostoma duodenale]